MPDGDSFDDFVASLTDFGGVKRIDDVVKAQISAVVSELRSLGALNRQNLEAFVVRFPDSVPILATCVGLTHEQLKNQLSHRLGTASWNKLARTRPGDLIAVLDDQF